MPPSEVRQRLEQKTRQWADSRRLPDFSVVPIGDPAAGTWPLLPQRSTVPEKLRQALVEESSSILQGRWRLFGHMDLQVDEPPDWQKDYRFGGLLRTSRSAFRLNHRELPTGADIKVLWDINRWQHLVRLAQAAWVLNDGRARDKCVQWLESWCRDNPPYTGWNWTSALETGIRLINFAWVDALLLAADAEPARLQKLRQSILPPHVWHAWRHRSYGSSANNHLLGELSGLIVSVARWPVLERWGASLEVLQRAFESELLAQFAPDGGNREQALNYQLFAWELCWASRNALVAAGRPVSRDVEERLRRAADFLVTVQSPTDPWDYGDSDSAIVTPFFAHEADAPAEWYGWFSNENENGDDAIGWWLGAPPSPMETPSCVKAAGDWLIFPESGQAVSWSGEWLARWDLSPLGYLSMASHGHLDALHFSLWLDGVAIIIDPGTGAYYGDKRLRAWLASWGAHNGPHVPGVDFPRRLGPFLWGDHHETPIWKDLGESTLGAEMGLPHGQARRQVKRLKDADRDGWQIDDLFLQQPGGSGDGFAVVWQFAPGTVLTPQPGNARVWIGNREGARFSVGFDAAWSQVEVFPVRPAPSEFPVQGDLAGLCSPAFRRLLAGPRIVLSATGANPMMYRTTILKLRKD